MKKLFYLLSAGSVILTSCSGNNIYQVQQAQIDSTVNAIVARHDAANAVRKDSTLKAMEKEKADSITREKEQVDKKMAADKLKSESISK